MTHFTQQVHGAVVLSGSSERLAQIKESLEGAFRCHHYRANALLISDVTADELPDLKRFAAAYDCRVEQTAGTRDVRIAAEEAVEQPKPAKVDVTQGSWYKTNQDAFPLLHVVEVRNEVDPDGILLYLYDVDLVSSDRMPQQATFDGEQIKGFGLKPATLDHFEDLDIAVPAGFEQEDPHVIPSVESDVEDLENAPKTAGVSLPQAQLAAQQLQQQLGYHCTATVAPADSGFLVEARLYGNPGLVPRVVAGTPVKYVR